MAAHLLAAASSAIFAVSEEEDFYQRYKKPKRTHKVWVRPWITDREDEQQCNTAYKFQKQLVNCDHKEFRTMLRMPPDTFDFILERIRHRIVRQDTNYRAAISPEERLSLTLKFLATGESSASLGEAYRVGRCTVGRIIDDTCNAIFEELGGEFIKTPTSVEEWEDVMAQFKQRWNYPACVGAIDGKHVRIFRPANSGSTFFNYKDFFSIIMLAIVNANYEYIYLDVGSEGQVGDGGIWKKTHLYKALSTGELNLPPRQILPGTNVPMGSHFVGDNAFALGEHLLKPFAHREKTDREEVFNYRLSRARRIVENVFGITVSRFRVLTTPIYMNPQSVSKMLLAIGTLHNILRRRCGVGYMPPGSIDTEDINYEMVHGDWRQDPLAQATPLEPSTAKNPTQVAKNMREHMADYFVSKEGEVHWQYKHLANTQDNLMKNTEFN